MRVRLPQPNSSKLQDKELFEYINQLVQALERAFEKLPEQPFTQGRINVTNLTKLKSLDATSGTLADVRQVLGTLLVELQESGKIS